MWLDHDIACCGRQWTAAGQCGHRGTTAASRAGLEFTSETAAAPHLLPRMAARNVAVQPAKDINVSLC